MKKLLSLLLTLCLLIAVTVIPVPAMAASGEIMFYYGDYGITDMPISHTIGEAIDYPELPANPDGELVWSLYNDVYEKPPVVLEDAYLQVHAVLLEGVYDFENHYQPTDDLTSVSGLRLSLDKDNGKGVMKFNNIAETYYNAQTNNTISDLYAGPTTANRYNSIDIGEVAAGASKTYRITVAVKRFASDLPLTLEAWTCARQLNYGKARTTYDASVTIPAVDVDDTEYSEYTIVLTTPDNLVDNVSNNKGNLGNHLFLQVRTDAAGTCVAYVDYIKVEELAGSVTYVIPENATVDGKNGNVTVGYAVNDTITFPEVVYAEGCTFDAWIDANGEPVTAPTLGGTYTLVIKEPVQMVTVTLNRGGVTEEISVEKGTEFTLPDTQFTDSSWWSNADAKYASYFVGYEGDKVTVTKDVTYYTAETYSDGKNSIYRNWTGLDTTTESFSYFYKTETSAKSSEWTFNGGTRVCTRLGVVEDNTTYRISITYKATTNADINFYFLTSNLTNSGASMRDYLEDGKIFHTVGANTDGWETVTFYITADLPAEIIESENGLDDTKNVGSNCGLYLSLGKDAGKDNLEFAIKKTKVEKIGEVVGTTGASVLTDAAAQEAGSQAIRYYFNYKTENEGADIVIGSETYEVVERGVIITNGAINNYGSLNATNNKYFYYSAGSTTSGYAADRFMINLGEAKASANEGFLTVKSVNGEDLKKMWSLEGDTITFSNYLINIPESAYNAKFLVKGYVTFKDADGNEHTVYSKSVNRSVNGIANVLNQRH